MLLLFIGGPEASLTPTQATELLCVSAYVDGRRILSDDKTHPSRQRAVRRSVCCRVS